MDFHATDLDGAYESLTGLNNLATVGGSRIVNGLKSLITSLKTHWIGNDATLHINNLINIYDGVAKIVDNVHIIAHNTSGPIVNAQTIRNSNGGTGEVGIVFQVAESENETLETLGNTTEYYVDPTGAPQDLTQLQTMKEQFDVFCTEFTTRKEELLSNWTSGLDRDKAVSDFEQFETDAANYKKYFLEAEQTLSNAVSNLKQLGE